jgi:hypothetical protein
MAATVLAGKFSGKSDPMTKLEYAAVMSGSRRAAATHDQCLGWVDKPLFSRDGASLVFAYHVGRCKGARGESPSSYLFTVSADGSGLWRCVCAVRSTPSHARH